VLLPAAAQKRAWTGTFEAQSERLFRALLLVTHDSTEEDLMQEAFVRVWERWDRVGTLDDPVGYLFKTAMNLHRSAIRRAAVAAKLASDLVGAGGFEPPTSCSQSRRAARLRYAPRNGCYPQGWSRFDRTSTQVVEGDRQARSARTPSGRDPGVGAHVSF
jgi:DNA-directed RNA polymerase specialized sigma24 family protein